MYKACIDIICDDDRSLVKIYTKKICSKNAFKMQASERDNAPIAIQLITYIFLRYLSIQ
jgi:hypothetical protein